MRIALLCPNTSSNSLVRTYPIAKVLARRHELQVLGFEFGGGIFAPYRDEFEYETIIARRMPYFLGQIREMARRVRADAVYAFKPVPSSLWVGLMAKRMHGIPLFLDIEDWEVGWYYDVPRLDRLKHLAHVERSNSLLSIWLTERLVRYADETFVVSRFLQKRFGGTLLAHGADTTVFDPACWVRSEALRQIGLEDGRYIVFTGAPMPNKGLDDLVEAVSRLGDSRLRVLVVGSFRHDPGYREQLIKRHGDRLILIGPRPHSDMPMFLAVADAVALPQRPCRETIAQVPGKVFEAMAMARPILATAVSDLPEILDGCGVVVPAESPDSLASGLDWILSNPNEAMALGQRARRRCEEFYSWDAMERILIDKFERGPQGKPLPVLNTNAEGLRSYE